MISGRRPELIAAVLAVLGNYKAFIHTPPKSLFTKTRGTLWEPDPGVPEMQKCGLLSITTRWYVGSVDPEKSPKMDYFAAIATDHHYGRIAMLWRSN